MENKSLTSLKTRIFFLKEERVPSMGSQWIHTMADK